MSHLPLPEGGFEIFAPQCTLVAKKPVRMVRQVELGLSTVA
jgi:hypothetical protein